MVSLRPLEGCYGLKLLITHELASLVHSWHMVLFLLRNTKAHDTSTSNTVAWQDAREYDSYLAIVDVHHCRIEVPQLCNASELSHVGFSGVFLVLIWQMQELAQTRVRKKVAKCSIDIASVRNLYHQ